MGTKEQLLALLEKNTGAYLSGEEIAKQLSISRTAVWKAVNALRQWGYDIHAVRNKGYCLDVDTDILSIQGIRQYLNDRWKALELEVLPCASSTNALLRDKANSSSVDRYVIAANQQTHGRGRLGRAFFSPPDTGLYLSLLLRPTDLELQEAVKMTAMAAVAACMAIDNVSGRQTQIKWVNDVFLNGKKVCGILTEGSYGLESGKLDYVIVGVGFNVYPPVGGFPEEFADSAGAILEYPAHDTKNRLAAEFLNQFLNSYDHTEGMDYRDFYRERSMVIGHPIQIISNSVTKNAYALDVDRDCCLIVRYEDGTVERLSSAEISIRPD